MKHLILKTVLLVNVLLLLVAAEILAGGIALQPARTVKGKVTGADDNLPIPGVSILIKGTVFGTQTDSEGNYLLEVPDDQGTLVISSIGYQTQEIAVSGRSVIDVILDVDITTLGEVVVVGYGTQERKDVTGSVSSIKPEQLTSLPVVTVSDALQGRAAGLQVLTSGTPGNDARMIIRGLSSINGTDPLIVIDGFPTQSGLNTINPNDVENIEILKDASATAIYGSRAANGVVIVTTKRGSKSSSGFQVDFFTAFQQPTNLTEMLNASQFAQLNNEMMAANGQPVNPAYADPSILGEGTDWLDAMIRTAPKTSISVSYSGGSDRST